MKFGKSNDIAVQEFIEAYELASKYSLEIEFFNAFFYALMNDPRGITHESIRDSIRYALIEWDIL
jgi:hypothetical protein